MKVAKFWWTVMQIITFWVETADANFLGDFKKECATFYCNIWSHWQIFKMCFERWFVKLIIILCRTAVAAFFLSRWHTKVFCQNILGSPVGQSKKTFLEENIFAQSIPIHLEYYNSIISKRASSGRDLNCDRQSR